MTAMIFEICPKEPRVDLIQADGVQISDLADCAAPGDAEPACRYVLDTHGPEFQIIARNAAGVFENRRATDDEISETARAIYFDSESDFSDVEIAKMYLVWAAAATD